MARVAITTTFAMLCWALLPNAPAKAQTWPPPDRAKYDLKTLCSHVRSGTPAQDPYPLTGNCYVYRDILYLAAGVDPREPEEQRSAKIRSFWQQNGQRLTCNGSGFGIADGSLLKYAVHSGSDAFIADVTRTWRLTPAILNRVDQSDGRTVLDYVEDTRAGSATPAITKRMDLYYRDLREAGAKHRVEIDGTDCRTSRNASGDASCPKLQ